jgi:hypothetical protein
MDDQTQPSQVRLLTLALKLSIIDSAAQAVTKGVSVSATMLLIPTIQATTEEMLGSRVVACLNNFRRLVDHKLACVSNPTAQLPDLEEALHDMDGYTLELLAFDGAVQCASAQTTLSLADVYVSPTAPLTET